MKTNAPDSTDNTGNEPLTTIPTGMDNDPKADEEVIDQQAGDQYPDTAAKKTVTETDDELAKSIAYALDGSGPGPTNSVMTGTPREIITEGIGIITPQSDSPETSRSDDEEDAAREWRSL